MIDRTGALAWMIVRRVDGAWSAFFRDGSQGLHRSSGGVRGGGPSVGYASGACRRGRQRKGTAKDIQPGVGAVHAAGFEANGFERGEKKRGDVRHGCGAFARDAAWASMSQSLPRA